jgi:alkylation response protein AidB-like acyl-CoA dehydrogenase
MFRELDPRYEDDQNNFRTEVNEFATEVLRPVSVEIDQMPYEEYKTITEKDSLYWEVMAEMKSRGYHRNIPPEEFGGGDFTARQVHTLVEELAWGSPGFAMALGVHTLPILFAVMTFDDNVEEEFIGPWMADEGAEFQGSWGLTEPQHGSETLQVSKLSSAADPPSSDRAENIPSPGVTSERDGDEWIINGAKAQWISSGPMATHCALQFDIDATEPSIGRGALVDLRQSGVTQGDPINKLGQRACPQGELEFNDARIPDRNVMFSEPKMLDPETALAPMSQLLCVTSAWMATVSTGLARAAFEEALAYAREREQRGMPIAEHQSVKRDLYEMFEKVETSRAYSLRVMEHVWEHFMEQFTFDASPGHALTAQVYCKRTAFEVAHKALQIHGGNGITKDHLIEKLFRDARVKMIEDGTTEVLGLEAADDVIENYQIG